jgi:hypothetical protein
MSEKLLEADFLTVDLRSIYSGTSADSTPASPTSRRTTSSAKPELPAKGDWSAWGALLKQRLEDNAKKSATSKRNSFEVETQFFEEFFKNNWEAEIATKLLQLGEPLKKAIKVLGFNPAKESGGNPILAFVIQDYVQEQLLKTGLLNVSTFKAIYNAVAKKLVASSEFFTANTYNIIYCQDLYKKSANEIEKYLELQTQILKADGSKYPDDVILENKKVFLLIEAVTELDVEKQAEEINKLDESQVVASVVGAKLNSLKLAYQIKGGKKVDTISFDSDEQNELVDKLDSASKIFAALMSLSLSTNNTAAGSALSNPIFDGLNASQVAEATVWLIKNNLIPKGQIRDSDAEALVNKLIAKVAKRI